jgi:hypothetical protein
MGKSDRVIGGLEIMRTTNCLLAIVCCFSIGCGDTDEKIADVSTSPPKPKPANVPDKKIPTSENKGRFRGEGFSVGTPDGFTWKFLQHVQNGDIGGSVYVCSKPGSLTAMSLTIEERERPHDGFRNAGVIGHFNGTIESLDETGAKVTGVTKPDLSKPIGDQVAFSVEGKQPNGDTVFCHGVSVFARRTYLFQTYSTSEPEARQVIAFASTFSED